MYLYLVQRISNTMGLFKSLLETVVGNVLTQVKEAAGQATGSSSSSNTEKPAQPVRQTYTEPVWEKSDSEWRTYFAGIIASEFPEYSVKENVAVTELAGDAADSFQLYNTRPLQVYRAEWGEPYTFVMYQGGAPKGIVMLGKGHSHDSNVKYLIARMYAKKLGLPYINFYTQMPNEKSYVVSRIGKFLAV